MTGLKRFLFRSLVVPLTIYARTVLRMHVLGAHRVPDGPKIYAHNHISSLDSLLVLPVLSEPAHTVIGPGFSSRLLRPVLNFFEQLNAMPENRATVVDRAVALLRRGEAVHVTPEGDIREDGSLGRFYPGVARIYRREPVPIVPMALVAPAKSLRRIRMLDLTVDERLYKGLFMLRGPFYVNVGEPFWPELRRDVDERLDNERIMNELKVRIQTLVEEVRAKYPEVAG